MKTLLIAILLLCIVSLAEAEQVILKFGHQFPVMSVMHSKVLVPWAQEIEHKSVGRIRIVFFPQEQAGPISQGLDLVTKNTIDIGMISPPREIGRFPLFGCFNFIYPSPQDKYKVIMKEYDKINPIYFSEVKILWNWVYNGYVLICSKIVTNLANFKGLVVGYPGGAPIVMLIKAFGGSPVQTMVGDMYLNLDRKLTDAELAPPQALFAFRLGEPAKTVVKMDIGIEPFLVVMNKNSWGKLSIRDQKMIDESIYDLTIKYEDMHSNNAKMGYNLVINNKHNGKVIELSNEDKKIWDKMVEKTYQSWKLQQ